MRSAPGTPVRLLQRFANAPALSAACPRLRGPLKAFLALLLLAPTTSGCLYSFRAGAFPAHIRTIAIVPFENQTTRLELTQEIYTVLLRNLPRSLGIRVAGEDVADAVVRGAITNYDVSTPNYRAGPTTGDRPEVLQRQVIIGVTVQILDVANNQILWEGSGLRGEGQYLEASETEDTGKEVAIDLLVQRIIDGAQSNW